MKTFPGAPLRFTFPQHGFRQFTRINRPVGLIDRVVAAFAGVAALGRLVLVADHPEAVGVRVHRLHDVEGLIFEEAAHGPREAIARVLRRDDLDEAIDLEADEHRRVAGPEDGGRGVFCEVFEGRAFEDLQQAQPPPVDVLGVFVEFTRGRDAQVARLVDGVGRQLADLLDGVLDEGQVVVEMLVFGREADAFVGPGWARARCCPRCRRPAGARR